MFFRALDIKHPAFQGRYNFLCLIAPDSWHGENGWSLEMGGRGGGRERIVRERIGRIRDWKTIEWEEGANSV